MFDTGASKAVVALISPRHTEGKAMSDIIKYANGPKFAEEKVCPKICNGSTSEKFQQLATQSYKANAIASSK